MVMIESVQNLYIIWQTFVTYNVHLNQQSDLSKMTVLVTELMADSMTNRPLNDKAF